VRKDDFVNALFEITKDILAPNQTMSLISCFVSGLENYVSYDDFFKSMERAQTMMQDFGAQDEVSPNLANAMRDQIQQRLQ